MLKNFRIPDWRGFSINDYSYKPILRGKPFLPVQTSRGCSFACHFCPYIPVQGEKTRLRKLEHIKKELLYLVEDIGVRSILFRDITFAFPKKRGIGICEMILDLNLNIEWACETRLDLLDDELIDLMATSGMKAVNLGIESNSQQILEKSGKKMGRFDRTEEIIKKLHSCGVKVQAFYMLGLLDDTFESMLATLKYAQKLNTYSAQFCVTTPFPGTRFFERVKKNLIHSDWSGYTEYNPVLFLEKTTPEEVRCIRDKAYRTYYLRPRWIFKYGLETFSGIFK